MSQFRHLAVQCSTIFLLLPDALFTTLVLTNDCHQLVFGFRPGFENWSGDYTQLPLFFVLYGWMAVRRPGRPLRRKTI